jgi:hypothetical protein
MARPSGFFGSMPLTANSITRQGVFSSIFSKLTDRMPPGCMRVVYLALGLVPGDPNLRGIDHHDVITGVDVRGEFGLVFATQTGRDGTGHTPKGLAIGVDDIPALFNTAGFGGIGFHLRYSLGVRVRKRWRILHHRILRRQGWRRE